MLTVSWNRLYLIAFEKYLETIMNVQIQHKNAIKDFSKRGIQPFEQGLTTVLEKDWKMILYNFKEEFDEYKTITQKTYLTFMLEHNNMP
jgi:hypothetical protein